MITKTNKKNPHHNLYRYLSNSMKFPLKTKTELPYDPVVSLLDIFPK